MVAPAFGAAGTYLAGGVRTTVSVPVPSGVTNNQVVLSHLYIEASGAVTPPTGFTEITPAAVTTGTVTVGRVFWKRATGSDSGTYAFTTPNAFSEAVAERYTGCVTSGSPIDVSNSAQRSSAGTTTPSVSVTTTGRDRLLVWSATSVQIGPWTPPTGYTERVDTGREISVATDELAAAGSSGSVTGTGPSAFMTAWLVALIPITSDTVTYTKRQKIRQLLRR